MRHSRAPCYTCWLLYLLCFSSSASTPDGPADGNSDSYIIVWRAGVDGAALTERLCGSEGGSASSSGVDAAGSGAAGSMLLLTCTATYSNLINGVAVRASPRQLAAIKLAYKNSIDYVARDRPLQLSNELLHPFQARMLPEMYNATWGLDSIDQPQLPLDTIYHYDNNGTGVHVYILDSGIRTSHSEFSGDSPRAFAAFDAVTPGGDAQDCHSHGTHVAAIVGGNRFGVAKNVTLHAVRVLDCAGRSQVSTMLKGLEWVARNHQSPAVVHMSLEGAYSAAVNAAVEGLVWGHNVHVVASAGNSGTDACRVSPASVPSAITVAAVDSAWARWSSANWGPCVDVFAPGVSILSAGISSDSATLTKTGTSMAAPFVTGVVALYLEGHHGASADEVAQKLYAAAIRGAVKDDSAGRATLSAAAAGRPPSAGMQDISSTPNRLLQSAARAQATLVPGVVVVGADAAPQEVTIILVGKPNASVSITAVVPSAWDGHPIADVFPQRLEFLPQSANASQVLMVHPRPEACEGDYHVTLQLQSDDTTYAGALHTIRVVDLRPLTGDTAAMARVIRSLPFQDMQDSSRFGDSYSCTPDNAAPDVVYLYTPGEDQEVSITTCGSQYDTMLLLAAAPAAAAAAADPTAAGVGVTTPVQEGLGSAPSSAGGLGSAYTCNDDDRGCSSNTANSRIDARLLAGVPYFIVVDGYAGASGLYTLSVQCTSCTASSGEALNAGSGGGAREAAAGVVRR